MDKKSYIDVAALSQTLDVPPSWIYERTRRNLIPHYKFGKYVRFILEEVVEFFKKQQDGNRSNDNM